MSYQTTRGGIFILLLHSNRINPTNPTNQRAHKVSTSRMLLRVQKFAHQKVNIVLNNIVRSVDVVITIDKQEHKRDWKRPSLRKMRRVSPCQQF